MEYMDGNIVSMSGWGQGPKVSPGANLVCTTPDSRRRFQREDFSVGPTADVIKEATNCGGLTSPRQLAASAKAGSLIAAIVSFSA
jgi:hypothetical protein